MTIKGLNHPEGIAVCANGDIVVAEYTGNCITIFNKKGEKIRSIKRTTLGEFNGPYRVAMSTYSSNRQTYRLQKLATDGVCVQSVGSSNRGNSPLEFYWSRGDHVLPRVVDHGNNRVQV